MTTFTDPQYALFNCLGFATLWLAIRFCFGIPPGRAGVIAKFLHFFRYTVMVLFGAGFLFSIGGVLFWSGKQMFALWQKLPGNQHLWIIEILTGSMLGGAVLTYRNRRPTKVTLN